MMYYIWVGLGFTNGKATNMWFISHVHQMDFVRAEYIYLYEMYKA